MWREGRKDGRVWQRERGDEVRGDLCVCEEGGGEEGGGGGRREGVGGRREGEGGRGGGEGGGGVKQERNALDTRAISLLLYF